MEQLTDKPLLEFANVTFGYGNNQDKVLQNVSFSIFPGDQIGIFRVYICRQLAPSLLKSMFPDQVPLFPLSESIIT